MRKNLILLIVISLFFLLNNAGASAEAPSVVINEIAWAGTAASANDEWIELYNNSAIEIDLAGWKFVAADGQPDISLAGKIAPGGFFLLERTSDDTISDIKADQIYSGSLGNNGEKLELKNSAGEIVDAVDCLSGWFAGDNAAKASLERIDPAKPSAADNWEGNNGQTANGRDANGANLAATPRARNSVFGFQPVAQNESAATSSPPADSSPNGSSTGGAPAGADSGGQTAKDTNSKQKSTAKEEKISTCQGGVIVSEILPNPFGPDEGKEFVEIYNSGNGTVDVGEWEFLDDEGNSIKIKNLTKNTSLEPEKYAAIFRSGSQFVLPNSGGTIKLREAGKAASCQSVKYGEAKEGLSFSLFGTKWEWSEAATPGAPNILQKPNQPPVVRVDYLKKAKIGAPVLFDASDSADEDGGKISFSWDFGDGAKNTLAAPEHIFWRAGKYKTVLTVSDGRAETKKEIEIEIEGEAGEKPVLAKNSASAKSSPSREIIINEILPNPAGSDEKEWIELKNIGKEKADLSGWKLADGSLKAKPYVFKKDVLIAPEDFLVVGHQESGISLNNDGDAVKLFDDFDELVDEIKYEKAIEGESYARGQNGKFFWTTMATPGKENIVIVSSGQQIVVSAGKQTASLPVKSAVSAKKNEYIEVALEKLSEREDGELVKTKGTVAVLPGVLGAQYFYIVGSPGAQVYSYSKSFPPLAVGDYIEVNGELSTVSGERRIKISGGNTIARLKHQEEPKPEPMPCEKIGDDSQVGRLASISGEVTKKTSTILYVDDGESEAIVYAKKSTGISLAGVKEGDKVTAVGIIGWAKSGGRLMPRSSGDIVVEKKIEPTPAAAGSTSFQSSQPRVLGEVAAADAWSLPAENKKNETVKYLIVIAIGVVVVLVGLYIRRARKK